MRIKQLSIEVANQIAAGEVIERPASIVKELLENSLDAKSSQIAIDIGYGGLNQIKISDNGCGIFAEDLHLALAPHATSKITRLDDLYSITSMGFRGEALASIASVSKIALSSRPKEQEHAMCLAKDEIGYQLAPCARNQGTTVDVQDIFYNAPVRKKFLKSERLEFQAIDLVVRRFALTALNIGIQFSHNGTLQLSLPPALDSRSKDQRIRRLMGKTFMDGAIRIEASHNGIELNGWISGPEYQRSQNDKMWVYINGRIVKDKFINNAIKQAYESFLYPGRHPSCLLYLSLHSADVDVNVHPTKHEVRFQQPRLIHDFICSQLSQVLNAPVEEQSSFYSAPALAKHHPLREASCYESIPVYYQEKKIIRDDNWYPFNEYYSLIHLAEQVYLINNKALQQYYWSKTLTVDSLPLAPRPLLVPVDLAFQPAKPQGLKQALELLGLELDCSFEGQSIVLSLPIKFPHLNIKDFLLACFKRDSWTIEELIHLFIEHQHYPSTIAAAERAFWLDFLNERLVTVGAIPGIIVPLSKQKCQELLDV